MKTPMLLLSPSFLDQSFPRDAEELRQVSIALGEIDEILRSGNVLLINIDVFSLFIEEVYWERVDLHPQLIDIVTVLTEWLVRCPAFVRTVNLDGVAANRPHPIPHSVRASQSVDLWSDQAARLLTVHDETADGPSFFIGIACDIEFSSGVPGRLDNPEALRTLPLVGPNSWEQLCDCFEWVLPDDLHRRSISFRDAKNNIHVLGGRVSNPPGGSHYKVTFDGALRSWSLDRNLDPQPDSYIRELESIVGLPFAVVKYILLNGTYPSRRYRLAAYTVS